MKLIITISALLLGSFVTADDVQSKPFNLVIQSAADKVLNRQRFSACHSGAAIESFCVSGRFGADFYFNTTEGSQTPIPGYEPPGVIVWNLPLGGEPNHVSEPMTFWNDPSTNVALPLLQPGNDRQYVTFDKDNQLAIFSYLDDSHTPPTGNELKPLKNWFVCQTYYSGYRYLTLAWVMGNGSAKPQNPSCVKVEVERRFV
ncbi:hypothetical protein L249_8884 [Ophiocordyceps polyrhachis-furcata BCC 54312]|uniref:DUF7907 domain-containing protein n=1 Tax=Ophiocordyceps polyrhachis-furcata BCC 54312 TaxID=1330021 RepID=A0A367L261_9HYPO|nr:hypothetical protein L249_8884 [Ophiocordyceps polyrhachis-furcata BCC 54312]